MNGSVKEPNKFHIDKLKKNHP